MRQETSCRAALFAAAAATMPGPEDSQCRLSPVLIVEQHFIA